MKKEMRIIDVYKDWKRDKDYLDLNLTTLKKLTELNKIVDDEVLNKINSLAYFLQSTSYKKPQEQYLVDLKNIVSSFIIVDKYFQSQKAFNIELSQFYEAYEIKDKKLILNSNIWREHNQSTIKKLNNQTTNEQKAFYSMVREIYQYGISNEYTDKKVIKELDRLKELPNFNLCKTTKSDSEIISFFKIKYKVKKNNETLKVGMQDLYNFFSSKFIEYEPIDFCNEILKHILKEKPKQKRYFTDEQKIKHQKISYNGKSTYLISNIKK